MVQLGRYRHYKGREYEVMAIGRHSDTMEEYVVYRGLYDSAEFGPNSIWIRPKVEFEGKVMVGGRKRGRFTKIV